MRKALFAQLLPYQILPPTHTHDVCTYSKSGDAPPSIHPSFATTKKSVAGLCEGLFCYLLYEIFVIRKTCSKTPKNNMKMGRKLLNVPSIREGIGKQRYLFTFTTGNKMTRRKVKKEQINNLRRNKTKHKYPIADTHATYS